MGVLWGLAVVDVVLVWLVAAVVSGRTREMPTSVSKTNFLGQPAIYQGSVYRNSLFRYDLLKLFAYN